MTNKKTQPSRLTKALLETADDMRRAGVMDAPTHAKITLRHLGDKAGRHGRADDRGRDTPAA